MAQAKTISQLKNMGGNKSAPYSDFSIKVQVIKVGHSANFTSSGGEEMQILNFSVADQSDTIMATLNEAKKFKLIAEGKSLHLRNFLYRNGKVVLTKNSKVMLCGPVDVPDDLKQKAVYLITPPSPQKTVAEIRSLPLRSNISLVGKVVKDDGIRNVKVGGTETSIHTIKLQTRDGQEINVSLWRELSTVPIHVGQFLSITQCITGEWQGQPQLNSSRNTLITEVETPERNITGVVEGVCVDEEKIEIVLNTDTGYEDLVANIEIVLSGLSGETVLDRDSLEETLSDMLPFHVRATTKGNEVVSIVLENADAED